MHLQVTPFVAPLLTAALIAAGIAMFALRHRKAIGATSLAWMMLAATLWSLGYLFELCGTDLPTKLFWSNLTFLAIASSPLALLAFAFEVAGLRTWLSWRRLGWFCVIPVLTLLLVWTSGWHPWFWTTRQLQDHGSYSTLLLGFGPGFYLHTAYSYLLVLVALLLVMHQDLGVQPMFKAQKLALLVSLLFPWLANLLHVLRVPPVQVVDPTPFAFSLTGLGLAWGLFGFRLLDLKPLERKQVFESLQDGFLVLDRRDRLIDFNPAAQEILLKPLQPWIGHPAVELLSYWPALLRLLGGPTPSTVWSPASDPLSRAFDVRASLLHDAQNQLAGRVILLHEVTHLKQAEATMQRQMAFLDALNSTMEAASRADNLEKLAALVLEQILQALQLEMGAIWVQDRLISRGLADEMLPAPDRLEGLSVLDEQQVIKIEDWPALDPGVSQFGLRALLFVPIPRSAEKPGRLGVMSAAARSWSGEEQKFLSNIASQLGQSADRLASLDRIQKHADLLEHLASQSEILSRGLPEQELIAVIVLASRDLVGADRAEVILTGEDADWMAEKADSGTSLEFAPQPKPVLVPDVRQVLPTLENAQAVDYQALGDWPLVYRGRPLAVLRCYYDHPHHWYKLEEEIMQIFARQAALALQSARFFDAERRQHSGPRQ